MITKNLFTKDTRVTTADDQPNDPALREQVLALLPEQPKEVMPWVIQVTLYPERDSLRQFLIGV